MGCDVPGGKTFLFAGTPAAMMAPSLQPPAGGARLSTSTEASGLVHLCLNARGQVHCIAYLGRREMQASKLSNLVGLHSSYLNGLQASFEAGLVPDLIEFLTQPWAELLHSDGFREMRAELLRTAAAGSGAASSLKGGVGSVCTTEALRLLQERAAELPAYQASLSTLQQTFDYIQAQN